MILLHFLIALSFLITGECYSFGGPLDQPLTGTEFLDCSLRYLQSPEQTVEQKIWTAKQAATLVITAMAPFDGSHGQEEEEEDVSLYPSLPQAMHGRAISVQTSDRHLNQVQIFGFSRTTTANDYHRAIYLQILAAATLLNIKPERIVAEARKLPTLRDFSGHLRVCNQIIAWVKEKITGRPISALSTSFMNTYFSAEFATNGDSVFEQTRNLVLPNLNSVDTTAVKEAIKQADAHLRMGPAETDLKRSTPAQNTARDLATQDELRGFLQADFIPQFPNDRGGILACILGYLSTKQRNSLLTFIPLVHSVHAFNFQPSLTEMKSVTITPTPHTHPTTGSTLYRSLDLVNLLGSPPAQDPQLILFGDGQRIRTSWRGTPGNINIDPAVADSFVITLRYGDLRFKPGRDQEKVTFSRNFPPRAPADMPGRRAEMAQSFSRYSPHEGQRYLFVYQPERIMPPLFFMGDTGSLHTSNPNFFIARPMFHICRGLDFDPRSITPEAKAFIDSVSYQQVIADNALQIVVNHYPEGISLYNWRTGKIKNPTAATPPPPPPPILNIAFGPRSTTIFGLCATPTPGMYHLQEINKTTCLAIPRVLAEIHLPPALSHEDIMRDYYLEAFENTLVLFEPNGENSWTARRWDATGF